MCLFELEGNFELGVVLLDPGVHFIDFGLIELSLPAADVALADKVEVISDVIGNGAFRGLHIDRVIVSEVLDVQMVQERVDLLVVVGEGVPAQESGDVLDDAPHVLPEVLEPDELDVGVILVGPHFPPEVPVIPAKHLAGQIVLEVFVELGLVHAVDGHRAFVIEVRDQRILGISGHPNDFALLEAVLRQHGQRDVGFDHAGRIHLVGEVDRIGHEHFQSTL